MIFKIPKEIKFTDYYKKLNLLSVILIILSISIFFGTWRIIKKFFYPYKLMHKTMIDGVQKNMQ